MTPPVFVVDTNVVVAGLITATPTSPVSQILDAMLTGSIIFLVSPELLDEYRDVLLRPRLTRIHGLSEDQVDVVLVQLVANAIWREPVRGARAPDRGDDHLWALLASHRDSILVTDDGLLLDHPPSLSSVMTPRACVDRFLPQGQ